MIATALLASVLLSPLTSAEAPREDGYDPFPAEWAAPPNAPGEETGEDLRGNAVAASEEAAPFAPARVEIGSRLRWEGTLGVLLLEQASRLRSSTPLLGAGFSLRPSGQLRLDSAWLFTWVQQGTEQLHVLNTFSAVRVRLHYARPLGGAWWTVGGGPVGYLQTTAESAPNAEGESSVKLAYGAALALGLETLAEGKLVRFELGAQSRGWRIDGLLSMSVGF